MQRYRGRPSQVLKERFLVLPSREIVHGRYHGSDCVISPCSPRCLLRPPAFDPHVPAECPDVVTRGVPITALLNLILRMVNIAGGQPPASLKAGELRRDISAASPCWAHRRSETRATSGLTCARPDRLTGVTSLVTKPDRRGVSSFSCAMYSYSDLARPGALGLLGSAAGSIPALEC